MSNLIPERKAELLAALRLPPSEGGYLQTSETLTIRLDDMFDPDTEELVYDVDLFCCLGVCTNLAVLAGVVRWDEVATNPVDDTTMVLSETFYSEGDAKKGNDKLKAQGRKTKVRRYQNHDDPYRGQHEAIWQVFYGTYEQSDMPGAEVMEYFGIDAETASEMAGMNDKGKTFIEIADWIEKYR